jgi:hypothetical protein
VAGDGPRTADLRTSHEDSDPCNDSGGSAHAQGAAACRAEHAHMNMAPCLAAQRAVHSDSLCADDSDSSATSANKNVIVFAGPRKRRSVR